MTTCCSTPATARTSATRSPRTFDTLAERISKSTRTCSTADNLPIVDDPLATPDVTEVAPNAVMPTGTVAPTTIGLALTGREPGMKEALLKSYGGTGKTEGAVALGLRWLASAATSQRAVEPVRSVLRRLPRTENVEAATAMALLAFQGAGYTPAGDPQHPFTPVVRRGWNALLKRHGRGRPVLRRRAAHRISSTRRPSARSRCASCTP